MWAHKKYVRGPLWATLLGALVAAVVVSLVVFVQSGEAAQGTEAPPDEPQILDGTVVQDAGQYPFMVALMDNTKGTDPFPFPEAFFCGGTLIDADSVLTAAHCVEKRREIVPDSHWDFHAVLGQPATLAGGATSFGENANAFGVRRVWLHPGWHIGSYDATKGPHKYDVAVVKLARTVMASPSRSAAPKKLPAKLPTISLAKPKQNGFEDAGNQASVAGWGRTGTTGGPSPNLRVANTTIVFDEVASSADVYSTKYEAALHVAAGKTFCTGDSGGPLFTRSGKKSIQFGIAQSGPTEYTNPENSGKCSKPPDPLALPDVYTEVNAPSIRSFITKHMKM